MSKYSTLLVVIISLIVFAECQLCPTLDNEDYTVNAGGNYTFSIYSNSTNSQYITSESIQLEGFYVNGSCINGTYLGKSYDIVNYIVNGTLYAIVPSSDKPGERCVWIQSCIFNSTDNVTCCTNATIIFDVEPVCPILTNKTYYLTAGDSYGLSIFDNDTNVGDITSSTIMFNGLYQNGSCITINGTTTGIVALIINGTLEVYVGATDQSGVRCLIIQSCIFDSINNDTCCGNTTVLINVHDIPQCFNTTVTPYIVLWNQTTEINLLQYIYSPSEYLVNASIIGGPYYGNYSLSGFNFTYTPYQPFVSDDTVNVYACDNDTYCSNCTFSIDIQFPPTCSNLNMTVVWGGVGSINWIQNASDPSDSNPVESHKYNGGVYISRIYHPKGNFTITSSGFIYYNSPINYTNTDTTDYTICDTVSNLCATCNVTAILESLMYCQNIEVTAYYNMAEQINVLGSDYNYQYPNSSYWIIFISQQPTLGTAYVNGSMIVYNATSPNGTDTIYYNVTAPNGFSASCYVSIDIRAYPVCGHHFYNLTETTSTQIMNVSTTDFSPINETLTYKLFVNTSTGGNSIQILGLPTYGIAIEANANYEGNDTINYQICETDGTCSNCTIYVRFIPQLSCQNQTYTTTENSIVTMNILLGSTYPYSNTSLILVSISNVSNHANLTLLANNYVRYIPDNSTFTGTVTYIYTITEDAGISVTCYVSIIVSAITQTITQQTTVQTTQQTTQQTTVHTTQQTTQQTTVHTTLQTTQQPSSSVEIGPGVTIHNGTEIVTFPPPFELPSQSMTGEEFASSTISIMLIYVVVVFCLMFVLFAKKFRLCPRSKPVKRELKNIPKNSIPVVPLYGGEVRYEDEE